MKSLSDFSDGKSEKSQSQRTSLSLPHTDICLAGALQQEHRRAQPKSEEQQGTSHSTHHTSQSLQGEHPFGNQTLGGAQSEGNFCSVRQRQRCRGQLQTWHLPAAPACTRQVLETRIHSFGGFILCLYYISDANPRGDLDYFVLFPMLSIKACLQRIKNSW